MQGVDEQRPQRVHLWTVKSVVDGQPLAGDAPALEIIDHGGQRLAVAGQDRGSGSVHGGDGQAIAGGCDRPYRVGLRNVDGSHSTPSLRALHEACALHDDPDGIGERQCTGDVCGRDLADAVPGDRGRYDTPGREDRREPDLDGEDRGLGELRVGQSRLVARLEDIEQGPAGFDPNQRVTRLRQLAERRLTQE